MTADERNQLAHVDNQTRRAWFREHWTTGVAFNGLCALVVRTWEPELVELELPFHDQLSAHDGVFHGGVVAALIDTAGTGAVAAGHDYNRGSRFSTVNLNVNYLAPPRGDLLAIGHCTRRGGRTHFAEVQVENAAGVVVARGSVVCSSSGERPGLAPL